MQHGRGGIILGPIGPGRGLMIGCEIIGLGKILHGSGGVGPMMHGGLIPLGVA